jgi:serine/threonine-protein kinase RsbW
VTTTQHVWGRSTSRSAEFPLEASSVPVARRALGADLASAHVEDSLRIDVLVIVSELLANSVRHARPLENGRIELRWRIGPAAIEVVVIDGGAWTRPVASHPSYAAVSGRGLGIVDTLAAEWGVEGAGTREQMVWAVVARPVAAVSVVLPADARALAADTVVLPAED